MEDLDFYLSAARLKLGEVFKPSSKPNPPSAAPRLPLPDTIKALVQQNPLNTEGIFNQTLQFLGARYPDYADTLFVLSAPNQALPTNAAAITTPYIHDVFKVMAPSLLVQGYDIQDKILETPFAHDFNDLMDQANVLVASYNAAHPASRPAPPLPHYEGLPHRDAFQLIPHWTVNYAGGRLDNVTISNNRISSAAQLQGVFASDGAFGNLRIINNQIKTGSAHQITIAGMLSGEISNNTDLHGKPLDAIELFPMRMGGGDNIFILSFHPSSSYQYLPIKGVPLALDKRRNLRTSVWNAVHYVQFRMDDFLHAFDTQTKGKTLSGTERAKLAVQLAPQFGVRTDKDAPH